MKKLLSFFAFALLLTMSFDANAVPRRYLIEDHTGAWCGWCPIGIEVIDQLLAQYDDLIVPVALHNGDKMQTSYQKDLATKLSITGYPSGVINRQKYSNKYGVHPTLWNNIIQKAIAANEEALVDVRIKSWSIDKAAKKLTAVIEAEMMADVPSQLAFNLYILEDGQTGSGTGWDQGNYLSKRPGYESSIFYNQPSSMKNFKHENVLLHMADKTSGSTEGFPESAVKGKVYTRTYEVDLATITLPYQNIDNLWIAALVTNTGSNSEVLNVVRAGVKKILPIALVDTKASEYINIDKGQTLTKTIKIKNPNSVDVQVKVELVKSASFIQESWTTSDLENFAPVTINAGQTGELSYQITSDKNIPNYFSATIKAKVVPVEGYMAGFATIEHNYLSKGGEIFMYTTQGNLPIVAEALPDYKDKIVTIPFKEDALKAFDHSTAKMSIFSETSWGELISDGYLSDFFQGIVEDGIKNNKPLLIIPKLSCLHLSETPASLPGLVLSPTVKAVLNDKLKIGGYSAFKDGIKALATTSAYVKTSIDVQPHAVTEGLGTPIMINDNTNYGAAQYADIINPLDEHAVKIIMNFQSVNPETKTAVAAAITLPTTKALYYGFDLDAIGNLQHRGLLLNNSIKWLLDPNSSVEDLTNTNIANIQISPNPTANNVNVTLNSKEGANGYVFITDMTGATVKSIVNNGAISNNYNINVSELSSGKYYLVTDINGSRSIAPILIAK